MKVCIIGPSGAGKTTAAHMLNDLLDGRGVANTSDVIAQDFVGWWNCRHFKPGENEPLTTATVTQIGTKEPWRIPMWEYAKMREQQDPCYTVVAPLERADIVTGTRTPEQMREMRPRVDWVVYIDRPGCQTNITDGLKPEDADVVLVNDKGLVELENAVMWFVASFGPGSKAYENRHAERSSNGIYVTPA